MRKKYKREIKNVNKYYSNISLVQQSSSSTSGKSFISLHVNLLSHKSRHSQDSVSVGSSCFPSHIYTEIVKVHD